jgi:hypothetical protein
MLLVDRACTATIALLSLRSYVGALELLLHHAGLKVLSTALHDVRYVHANMLRTLRVMPVFVRTTSFDWPLVQHLIYAECRQHCTEMK